MNSQSDNPVSTIRLNVPVTILLERRIVTRSFWSMPSWYLDAVVVGDNLVMADNAQTSVTRVGNTAKGEIFAWPGFHVTFYKDACERYWHALIGEKPLVYVICRDQSDAETPGDNDLNIQPAFVTVDYDEATASAETDSLVLSARIPGELYRYMEKFVLQHYRPKPFEKRKRRAWSENPPKGRPGSNDGKPA